MTVITPTVRGRERLLERCVASVGAQSVPVDHLILEDADGEGPSVIRNRLVGFVKTGWILPLDDDDELDPDCVQVLLENAGGVDIVYPWCRMVDRTDGWVPNKLFWAEALFKQNYIPVTALIRTEAFEMLGGYRGRVLEDWVLWQWAYLHGLKFRCVPEVLWSYHHHAGQNFQLEGVRGGEETSGVQGGSEEDSGAGV
ncbi:MAG: glycosyltransferase [Sulfuricaulis sp.]